MAAMSTPFPGLSNAKSELFFHRNPERSPMATSLEAATSTRSKLLRARQAAARLAQLTTDQKNALLQGLAHVITTNASDIIEANQFDLNSSGLSGAMRDRLLLTPQRIAAMVNGILEVASLSDPIGET